MCLTIQTRNMNKVHSIIVFNPYDQPKHANRSWCNLRKREQLSAYIDQNKRAAWACGA